MNHPDDDCTVMTDMPLSDEVADFIERGLRGDMTNEDVEEWCDKNLGDIVEIYEKYGHPDSHRAEMVLVFAKALYVNNVSNAWEKVSHFVALQ